MTTNNDATSALEQAVDERDAAEEAMSQAYFLIMGRSPEWSNLFGYKEALEEIDDAQTILRTALQKSAQVDGLVKAAEAWSAHLKLHGSCIASDVVATTIDETLQQFSATEI